MELPAAYKFEDTLWKLSVLRKICGCCACGAELWHRAYRPINPSNLDRRADRMCPDCMKQRGKEVS